MKLELHVTVQVCFDKYYRVTRGILAYLGASVFT
jgi:hypothetical protein